MESRVEGFEVLQDSIPEGKRRRIVWAASLALACALVLVAVSDVGRDGVAETTRSIVLAGSTPLVTSGAWHVQTDIRKPYTTQDLSAAEAGMADAADAMKYVKVAEKKMPSPSQASPAAAERQQQMKAREDQTPSSTSSLSSLNLASSSALAAPTMQGLSGTTWSGTPGLLHRKMADIWATRGTEVPQRMLVAPEVAAAAGTAAVGAISPQTAPLPAAAAPAADEEVVEGGSLPHFAPQSYMAPQAVYPAYWYGGSSIEERPVPAGMSSVRIAGGMLRPTTGYYAAPRRFYRISPAAASTRWVETPTDAQPAVDGVEKSASDDTGAASVDTTPAPEQPKEEKQAEQTPVPPPSSTPPAVVVAPVAPAESALSDEERAYIKEAVEEAVSRRMGDTSPGAWSYTAEAPNGPSHWGQVGYPKCSEGLRQSPINIEGGVVARELPTLAWQVPVEKAGGGVQVSVRSGALVAEGWQGFFGYAGLQYKLASAAVHTPSEHAVGGVKMDMEVQFTHEAEGDGGRVLVVSALFKAGASQSPEWVSDLAKAAYGGGAVAAGFEGVAMSVLGQMDELNPSVTNAQGYFQYLGSLTVPPCTEGVTWLVLKNPLPVTDADLKAIAGAAGGVNTRPLQAVNGRDVYDSHMV